MLPNVQTTTNPTIFVVVACFSPDQAKEVIDVVPPVIGSTLTPTLVEAPKTDAAPAGNSDRIARVLKALKYAPLPAPRYPTFFQTLLDTEKPVSIAAMADELKVVPGTIAGMVAKLSQRMKRFATPDEVKEFASPVRLLLVIDYSAGTAAYALTPSGRAAVEQYLQQLA